VGRIEGASIPVVPDRVEFKLDRRMIPEEDPAVVEAELTRLIAGSALSHAGVGVEVRRLLPRAARVTAMPGQEKLVRYCSGTPCAFFGEPIPAQGSPLYTDARHYAEAGVPSCSTARPRTISEANATSAPTKTGVGRPQ